MNEMITVIIEVLLIGIVCAIIATNLINGIKESVGLTKIKTDWVRIVVIKLLTVFIDGFIDYWVYFNVKGLTDIITFVVVVLCTIAGAETVYNIVGKLNDLKAEEKANEIIDSVNEDEYLGEEGKG